MIMGGYVYTVENGGDKESLNVRTNFFIFLHDYINENKLRSRLIARITPVSHTP